MKVSKPITESTMKEGSVFSSTSNQVLNTEGGVDGNEPAQNPTQQLQGVIKMKPNENQYPSTPPVENCSTDSSNKSTSESPIIEVENNTMDYFFLDLQSDSTDRLEVLNVLTGTGKTEVCMQFMRRSRGEEDFKVCYAGRTIQEILEVVLRMRRAMIESGIQSCHANRYLKKNGRLSFNFDGNNSKDLKKINELLSSNNWTDAEKGWVKSIKCSTNKYEVQNKLVFTTHANLQKRSNLFSDYTVIIDEIPSFAYCLSPVFNGINAASLTETHLMIAKATGHEFIDPTAMSPAIENGLVKITDFSKSAVLYHINPIHPFKRCIIMTAYAETSEIAVLNKLGMGIKIITPIDSVKALNSVASKIELEVLDHNSVTQEFDTVKLKQELLKAANNPSKAFVVSTAVQGSMDEVAAVRTNKTGSNSLSDKTECLVMTQLNMNSFERNAYISMFGEIGFKEIERNLAGSKLLQSIFRGCIRKGEKMRLVLCSKECGVRVLNVLKQYSK